MPSGTAVLVRSRDIILALVLGVAMGSAAPAAPAAPAPPTSAPAAPLSPEVDRILTRLEERQVDDLRADVTWETEYVLSGDRERKRGTIWYKRLKPVASFKVRFESRIVGDRKEPLGEEHMFDGRWYIELQPAPAKTVTRREIRAADDRRDPYKLGEGAFPVPFGQRKADILREFDVALLTSAEKPNPRNALPPCDRVRLTPKPGTQTGERYESIDFWVSRDGPQAGLPLKVMAAQRDGTGEVNSYFTVTFADAQLNTGFNDSIFRIETPSGYAEIVEPLEPQAP